MKIKTEHLLHMRQEIARIWTKQKHEAHRTFIVNEGKAKDVEKRLRWDWLHYAKLTPYICKHVYSYANDSHIDTALRRIMRELEAGSSKTYYVFADYGYASQEELFKGTDKAKAIKFAENKAVKAHGHQIIEVAWFADTGEYITIWTWRRGD